MPVHETHTAGPNWQADSPLDPARWITLCELAAEGFGGASTLDERITNLANQFADEVILDDVGRRCLPRAVARAMFTERRQQQQQAEERQAARKARLIRDDPVPNMRRRVHALAQRETFGSPLADIKAQDYENDWQRAADHRDELSESDRTGIIQYHSMIEREEPQP